MNGLLLKIRKPEQQDIPIMTEWFNDPQFIDHLYGTPHQTNPDVIKRIHGILNQNAKDTTQNITLIAEKFNNEPVGLLMFHNLNWKHRNVEMNNAIGSHTYRQLLYGADLYLLGLSYAFSELNLHKVYGYTYATNSSAYKLNHVAATLDGTLKNHVYRKGSYQDVVVFSILRRHFQEFLTTHQNGIVKKFVRTGMFSPLLSISQSLNQDTL